MVARARCYYSTPFKYHKGVSQGGPLYPTIFNMVVDVFIRHWVTLLAADEEGLYVFGQAIQWMAASFYTNDSLLASPWTSRI